MTAVHDAPRPSRPVARPAALVRGAIIVLLGLLLLSACGTAPVEQRDSSPAGDMEYAIEPAPGGAPPDVRSVDGGTTVPAAVITTGHATVHTEDPATAAEEFTTAVTEAGGRIEAVDRSSHLDSPLAVVTARVPAEEFAAVLATLDRYGEVLSQSTQASDVTQQKVDLEARQAALQASIDRLTGLMAEADTVEDLLRAEESLTQRQADLDSLTAQLDHLDDQVAMSTLQVTFTGESEGWRPPSVFERAWDAFVASLESTLIVSMALLPWLAIAAVVVGLVLLALRRRRGRRSSTPPGEGRG